MRIKTAFLGVAAVVLCCSCTSVTPVFGIKEDPFRFDFEKPTGKSVEVGMYGQTSMIFHELAENSVLVELSDKRVAPFIEKQWLSVGQSKYFKVSEDEYVLSVLGIGPKKEDKDTVEFEIATWKNFCSRCRLDDNDQGAFLFGSF